MEPRKDYRKKTVISRFILLRGHPGDKPRVSCNHLRHGGLNQRSGSRNGQKRPNLKIFKEYNPKLLVIEGIGRVGRK